MTPKQITDVQESWELVKPIADEAARLFYSKLFELDETYSEGVFELTKGT